VKRDFAQLSDLTKQEHATLFARARALKEGRRTGKLERTLEGRTLALVFEKASTRTRLSFEAAMFQLGGHAIDLPPGQSQLSRGEPLADTARVLSRYVDGIVFRTFGAARFTELAKASTVPVINGLTDQGHPVQVLADLFTLEERFGRLPGLKVAFVGDCASNMARSFLEAAPLFGFELRLAAPAGYQPPAAEVQRAGASLTDRPLDAVAGADAIVTDVWTSMGQEAESARRVEAFRGFCVDEPLVAAAKPTCVVLHCLPAHRGEEISEGVLEGPRSAVFDEAENRLHVQKALLELLLGARTVR
jgi:ornithine carbamoyltransferase